MKLKEIVLEIEGYKKAKKKEVEEKPQNDENGGAPNRLVNALDNAGYQKYFKTAPAWAKPAEEDGTIETLEGPMNYKKGDYLCVGPNGDKWPCYKDVFEKTYELAEE